MTQFSLIPDPVLTKRQKGGKRAQRKGQSFQTLIELSAAAQRSVVYLQSLPSMGAVRVGPTAKLVPTKICCDFIGSFVDTFAIAFDAKATAATCFPAEMLKPHQLDFLRDWDRTGQIGGLLVKCECMGRFLWRDIKRVDGGNMPFTRDGVLLPSWHDLGAVTGMVDFKALLEVYV